MKIKRKPKSPSRSNPPKKPIAPSNKAMEVDSNVNRDDLEGERVARQWEFYSRVGDTSSPRATKEENVYEYYKRTTGKELERPIITVDEAKGKTDKELEELAEGHDMELEGISEKSRRTAIWLYITGQKSTAYKEIKNRRLSERGMTSPLSKHLE